MTAIEVRALLEAEIAETVTRPNSHGLDLKLCLVPPRKVVCDNSYQKLNGGKSLSLWVVLEENPGSGEGYLIVFDDRRQMFGLAYRERGNPSFVGYHSTFLKTLQGM